MTDPRPTPKPKRHLGLNAETREALASIFSFLIFVNARRLDPADKSPRGWLEGTNRPLRWYVKFGALLLVAELLALTALKVEPYVEDWRVRRAIERSIKTAPQPRHIPNDSDESAS